ncbi:hypothetical protein [Alkalibacillus haloalkaliphilus]|uniref:N-acetyltransferase domain-containing protein n=1 Tax=Alkalibacillus haloalkaliphilus TaxID=94136 RepID=A0A511W6J8_9BACI|nr:hypothetical protein [Alkalibacillus haloalkaliphilus]GEN46724.1 hypothetical protein AHA02nite_25000 [Alkalibacillus haloalkaliphilus]
MFYFKLNDDSELRLLEPRNAEKLFLLIDKSRYYLREWLSWVDSTEKVSDSEDFIRDSLNQLGNDNGFQAG